MKVMIDGKVLFEIDVTEIPEAVEITKETRWDDEWLMFIMACLMSGKRVKNRDEQIAMEIAKKYGYQNLLQKPIDNSDKKV